MNKINNKLKVMIYSKNWTHQVAIEYTYRSIKQTRIIIQGTRDTDILVSYAINTQPNLLIIDDAPRNAVALTLALRQQCPDTAIIFMQDEFLFSDKIVGKYFDGIALKKYDALMNDPPCLLLAEYHCLLSTLREEVNLTKLPSWRTQGVSEALQSIKQLMHVHFSHLIASPRAQEVVLGWLVKGVEPITAGRLLGCSSKVVYHYRLMAMKVLGIQNRTRDFIASLTVTAGPVSYYPMREHRPALVSSPPPLPSHEQVKIKTSSDEKQVLANIQEYGVTV